MDSRTTNVTCGKSFAYPAGLSKHMISIHEGQENILKGRIHANSKCEYCKKQFGRRDNLKQHINAVHKGIKRIRGKKMETISSLA